MIVESVFKKYSMKVFKRITYCTITIMLLLIGGLYWYCHSTMYIISSEVRCFEFFDLDNQYSDNYIDMLYSQGKKWDSFGSKAYWYGNFTKSEFNQLVDDFKALGASEKDSTLYIVRQQRNIHGTATLQLKQSEQMLYLLFEER